MNEKIEWDYIGFKSESSDFWTQKDWCQTLITRINQCSAQIHKASLRGGANSIELHTRFKPLFQMLEYYHENGDSCILMHRYKITFTDDTLKNSIKVWYEENNDKLENSGYVLVPVDRVEPSEDKPIGELSLKIFKLDTPEAQEHLSNCRRNIQILNYTDEDAKHLAEFVEQENTRIDRPTPMDVVVGARTVRLKESLSKTQILETNNEVGKPKWNTEHEQMDNKTLLEEYRNSFDGSKGILFYFVKVSEENVWSSEKGAWVGKGEPKGINAKSVFIDMNDFEGSLVKMDEISSGDRFHSWAGSHKPINQLPPHLQAMDKKASDDFMNEIREFAMGGTPTQEDSIQLIGEADKPEKLRAQWSPEMAQDITGYFGMDAEKELLSMLCEFIGKELAPWGGKEKLAECKNIDEFFVAMKELGYELGPTITDPTNFAPVKSFYRSDCMPKIEKPIVDQKTGQINIEYPANHEKEDIYISQRRRGKIDPETGEIDLSGFKDSDFPTDYYL